HTDERRRARAKDAWPPPAGGRGMQTPYAMDTLFSFFAIVDTKNFKEVFTIFTVISIIDCKNVVSGFQCQSFGGTWPLAIWMGDAGASNRPAHPRKVCCSGHIGRAER